MPPIGVLFNEALVTRPFRRFLLVLGPLGALPAPAPEGCPGAYTLQLSQASALLVWCQDSIGGPSSASHTTTYHLNYVAVPRTYIIHKDSGQHVLIDLTKEGDAIVVSGVR